MLFLDSPKNNVFNLFKEAAWAVQVPPPKKMEAIASRWEHHSVGRWASSTTVLGIEATLPGLQVHRY